MVQESFFVCNKLDMFLYKKNIVFKLYFWYNFYITIKKGGYYGVQY